MIGFEKNVDKTFIWFNGLINLRNYNFLSYSILEILL